MTFNAATKTRAPVRPRLEWMPNVRPVSLEPVSLCLRTPRAAKAAGAARMERVSNAEAPAHTARIPGNAARIWSATTMSAGCKPMYVGRPHEEQSSISVRRVARTCLSCGIRLNDLGPSVEVHPGSTVEMLGSFPLQSPGFRIIGSKAGANGMYRPGMNASGGQSAERIPPGLDRPGRCRTVAFPALKRLATTCERSRRFHRRRHLDSAFVKTSKRPAPRASSSEIATDAQRGWAIAHPLVAVSES